MLYFGFCVWCHFLTCQNRQKLKVGDIFTKKIGKYQRVLQLKVYGVTDIDTQLADNFAIVSVKMMGTEFC